jgi:hypothetical protein
MNTMQDLQSADKPDLVAAANGRTFYYKGWQFACTAVSFGGGQYEPRVRYSMLWPCRGFVELPVVHSLSPTAAEAICDAEQQAIRWVETRMGDGRGQG